MKTSSKLQLVLKKIKFCPNLGLLKMFKNLKISFKYHVKIKYSLFSLNAPYVCKLMIAKQRKKYTTEGVLFQFHAYFMLLG